VPFVESPSHDSLKTSRRTDIVFSYRFSPFNRFPRNVGNCLARTSRPAAPSVGYSHVSPPILVHQPRSDSNDVITFETRTLRDSSAETHISEMISARIVGGVRAISTSLPPVERVSRTGHRQFSKRSRAVGGNIGNNGVIFGQKHRKQRRGGRLFEFKRLPMTL